MASQPGAQETVARYMALSYGYNQSSFPGKETLQHDRVLSPEEEEFADADRSLEDLCIASRPGRTLPHPFFAPLCPRLRMHPEE